MGRGGRTKAGFGEDGWVACRKTGVLQRGYKKLTEAISDRLQLALILDGGGSDEKKSPKSGGIEAFIGGGGRNNGICISVSAMVDG